ncbi:hypothetical protein LCGC14_1483360 [marine sediment metagenome]|uniref:Uncharacterized protein n=1 Tax=marine sediment metagenome TaxID=412755 RepID=A0A0F9LPB9_9ZZZZ
MAGQKNDCCPTKSAWGAVAPDAAGSFSRLTWLSLVELLPSRARLRFTKQGQVYQDGMADEG